MSKRSCRAASPFAIRTRKGARAAANPSTSSAARVGAEQPRVKLFQIEEPDGGPAEPSGPGAAIAIDVGGARAEVAFSVGGNAIILDDRAGFEQALPVPPMEAGVPAWQELLEGARMRAERALARPVTHAVLVLAAAPAATAERRLRQAAERA